jgi:cytochrome c oxidase subunit II
MMSVAITGTVIVLTGTAIGFFFAGRTPSPVVVAFEGADYDWQITLIDGGVATIIDGDLHLPTDAQVVIHLTSLDYIYTFALPDLDLNQVAVPDLVFDLEFATSDPDTIALRADQLCGFRHGTLMGKIVVESRDDFERWRQQFPTRLRRDP